jgi:hypothetical protein
MAAAREAIGENLYRFYSTDEDRNGDNCVISGHGVYLFDRSFPKSILTNILFYSKHGETLRGSHVREILAGSLAPTATYSEEARCPDYNLSKYGPDTYDKILRWVAGSYIKMDVITIRNRSLFGKGHVGGLRLSTVIKMLKDAGYAYQNVHCSFCRSLNPLMKVCTCCAGDRD